ncbi:VOC family protein [Kutzneria sp. CA-103260]|uniref:VOC family protein n=1 Tax=Kutzneria sp. CA-103260 TaxID=2802641 RepID=UPI001BA78773|nr:VOC family protein [Kutzneria sp. CA-103260]QUQ70162.1 glyoxalase/bleomycin resistance protein/dioxygenase [Kutzneria sp. CA-103260]
MELIAFAPATDLARAVAFYGSVLGLTHEETTPFAAVFRAGPVMLRVTKVESLQPQPFTVLGWSVSDIRATVADLTARGVAFTRYDGMGQDSLGIWTTPDGSQIAWFRDPDGNTLSLTQFA